MIKSFTSKLDSTRFRRDEIVELCKGKSVLHLGFIQHAHLYKQKIEEGIWLHSQIVAVSERVVGIDYLSLEVKKIEDTFGYEVYVGDVMRLDELDIKLKFDVIVCGELIEHVESPGLMLNGLRRFMHLQSLLIVTTPNPWSRQRLKLIQRGILEDQWLNPEHTAWYSYQTLKQLLERMGYETPLSGYYYGQSRQTFLRGTEEGLRGRILLIKRMISLYKMTEHQYDGLFFVASLK